MINSDLSKVSFFQNKKIKINIYFVRVNKNSQILLKKVVIMYKILT